MSQEKLTKLVNQQVQEIRGLKEENEKLENLIGESYSKHDVFDIEEENKQLKEENEELEIRVDLYAEHNKKLNRDMDESEKYDWKKKYHHRNSQFIALENIEKKLKDENETQKTELFELRTIRHEQSVSVKKMFDFVKEIKELKEEIKKLKEA